MNRPKLKYSKPTLTKINLDNSVSLVMQSTIKPPDPRGGDKKGASDPFASLFDDKTFG